jgi:hypothetical protein
MGTHNATTHASKAQEGIMNTGMAFMHRIMRQALMAVITMNTWRQVKHNEQTSNTGNQWSGHKHSGQKAELASKPPALCLADPRGKKEREAARSRQPHSNRAISRPLNGREGPHGHPRHSGGRQGETCRQTSSHGHPRHSKAAHRQGRGLTGIH